MGIKGYIFKLFPHFSNENKPRSQRDPDQMGMKVLTETHPSNSDTRCVSERWYTRERERQKER